MTSLNTKILIGIFILLLGISAFTATLLMEYQDTKKAEQIKAEERQKIEDRILGKGSKPKKFKEPDFSF